MTLVSDAVQVEVRRLAERLERAAIPYALAGDVALQAHGLAREPAAVDVLLTGNGLDGFRQQYGASDYVPVTGRPRKFVARECGVPVNVFLTGHQPGWTRPKPFPFPDPADAGERRDGLRVLALAHLVQLKLAAGRFRDLADVVALIGANRLTPAFVERLHPAVRAAFDGCWEEIRRQIEFESRD